MPSFDVLNTLPGGANLSHINRGLGTPLSPTQPPPFTLSETYSAILNTLALVLSNQQVILNELEAVVAKAQSILNSRPLTQNPDDPTDAEPLTPHHLLMLKSNQAMPPGSFSKQDPYSRRRWRQVQYLADVLEALAAGIPSDVTETS